jgi:phage terminase large subunit-like protein
MFSESISIFSFSKVEKIFSGIQDFLSKVKFTPQYEVCGRNTGFIFVKITRFTSTSAVVINAAIYIPAPTASPIAAVAQILAAVVSHFVTIP